MEFPDDFLIKLNEQCDNCNRVKSLEEQIKRLNKILIREIGKRHELERELQN